jgi:hypothetical protein
MAANRPARLFRLLPWLFFVLWLLALAAFFLRLDQRGLSPIDFLSYQRAAATLARGESPYLRSTQSLAVWRYFHQVESELLAAHARGEAQAKLREISARPQQPGPYQYPPSLALLVAQLPISPVAFAAVTLLSILGFAWLWLESTQAAGTWLLLLPISWDLLASTTGGNAEVSLLFIALLAGWTLWHSRVLIAAPLIAVVLLVKPFYALFFVALLAFRYLGPSGATKPTPRSLLAALALLVAAVALEAYRWGSPLRAEALHFALNAWDSLWFVLPVTEQTPMSAWNRTPLQALVNAGVPVGTGQVLALGLWLLLFGLTLWRLRGRTLAFPLAFALALTLLYWGRPVGWGFIYLEFVVAVVVWPGLVRWQKTLFMTVALVLLATRWVALGLAVQGAGMPLLTLQTPHLPWETWLVLPAAWLLLLRATARPGAPPAPATGDNSVRLV